MSDHLTLSVTASGVPRGSGDQTETVFVAQSMTASFAWGSAPGTATIVYVGNGAPIQTGAMIELRLGAHYFCGICKSDVGNTGSSEGTTRTLQFADLREFLSWDYVFCAFNKPWVVLVNGVRQKRYRHVYPANFDTLTWTITNAPLNATEMLEALFEAPTVGTRWAWDLTDRNLFPGGLMNHPIYDFDCLGGKRLDAALNEICERSGCVFGLISTPTVPYNLVFTRKGYGTMADFPANSDNRRMGVALSGHPTNVRVLGDRNFYQVMDVVMEPDWAPAWESFIVFELFTEDIYQRLYAATPSDPEGYVGRQLANARALTITVAEYAALAGAQFADGRKYAGRWRMDMPCALYLSQLLMRAFRPAAGFVFTNAEQSDEGAFSANAVIPLTSLDIADRLLCKVYQSDPTDGTMQFDLTTPADGNGYAIVQGYQVGADLFKTIGSAQFNLDFFKNVTGVWSHTPFQIDDSGEGVRFIIFDEPVIVSDDLVVGVDGHAVINADFTLRVPAVKAALVFEAERFSYWQGTWPNVGRDVVENVGGLNAELVVADGEYQEVLYANGVGSQTKAREIATWTLLRQYYYNEGGFKLIWVPATPVASFGMGLTSLVDRVTITMSPREGTVEVVDLTNERQRDFFEPEREFDRRTMGTSLFPGQAELRIQAEYSRKLAAAFKQLPGVGARLSDLLNGALGNDEPLLDAWFVNGEAGSMPAGTAIRKQPTTIGTGGAANTNTVATPNELISAADTVFVGVTVRDQEDTTKPFKVQHTGRALAQVIGPVAVNGAVGLAGDVDSDDWQYLMAGGTPMVGFARQAINDDSIVLIECDLGRSGGSSGVAALDQAVYVPAWTGETPHAALIAGVRGGYVYAIDPASGAQTQSARFAAPSWGDSTMCYDSVNDKLIIAFWNDQDQIANDAGDGNLADSGKGFYKINPITLATEMFKRAASVPMPNSSGYGSAGPRSVFFYDGWVYAFLCGIPLLLGKPDANSAYVEVDPVNLLIGGEFASVVPWNEHSPAWRSLAVDEDNGLLWDADCGNEQLRSLDFDTFSDFKQYGTYGVAIPPPGTEGPIHFPPYGLCVVPSLNQVIMCGRGRYLQVFAIDAGTFTATIDLGDNPVAPALHVTHLPYRVRFNPADGYVYVPGLSSNQVIIVDPATAAVVATQNGYDSPIDVVFTPTQAWAVQQGAVGLKAIENPAA